MKEKALFSKEEQLLKEWFSGEAFLNPLVAKDKNNEFSVGGVTFEPEAGFLERLLTAISLKIRCILTWKKNRI